MRPTCRKDFGSDGCRFDSYRARLLNCGVVLGMTDEDDPSVPDPSRPEA